MTLELTDKAYEHLKNVLIWAALYDSERNNGKNRTIYDLLLEETGALK